MNASPYLRSPRAGRWIVLALLIGAFGLRLWKLNEPSIWHDEAWSIRAIRDPIGTPDDNTPFVYYGALHFLWLGAGETPLALRYGSVLLDLITLALAVRIIREWFGREAAILTAVFFGASPLLWAYAREVRAYVAVPLLTLLLLWQTDVLLKPRDRFPWRVWAGLLITELVLLYTHNLGVPVVGWLNLVVGGVWLWQRRWESLGIWLGGQIGVLAAYLPWLYGQSPSGTPLNTPPRVGFSLVWRIWQGYFTPISGQPGAKTALEIGCAVSGLAALFSIVAMLAWNRNRRMLLLLSQALVIPVLSIVELLVAGIDFHPRYMIAGLPATLMLLALVGTHLPARFELRWIATPAMMGLAWGVAAASLSGLLDKPQSQHDNFQAVADYYAALPDDAVIVIPYGWEPALQVYYADKVNIRAEFLGIQLHSDSAAAIEKINAALEKRSGPIRVELLTWYQLPADVRGMYPCLLESAGRPAGPAFTVQGITTQGYWIERPLALTSLPDAAAEYGQMALAGAASGGRQSVCVQTDWTLQQAAGDDWRVAGRILTTRPPAWIVAQSDTDIRRDDQAPTSRWKPGQRGSAFSLLRFPNGAPPGDYTLQVGIYSRSHPNGLDRLVNGIPVGGALTLAAIQPAGTNEMPETIQAQQRTSIVLDQGAQLVGYDAQGGTLSPGQELRVTLHLTSQDRAWSRGTVTLRGDGWELAQPVNAVPAYSLDWHAFVVPADASGTATLAIESETTKPAVLATYTIEKTDRLFVPPPFDVPVNALFSGMAELEGFSVEPTTLSPDQALELTLVWQVITTPGTSYKVFTHLLDANGQVIAQHDGFPVNGTRLTTGWVPGEYIVDPHSLTFLRTDYQGSAFLEVGLYNPETRERVFLSGGSDHLLLPLEITVQ